nr:uncharacterized protein LOC133600598 [Nerophis lumbriciformis]
MPSNVEIKAKVSHPLQFAKMASELSRSDGVVIRQRDTFFHSRRGRLKLRDFTDGSGQLIFYKRADEDGPKLSRYSISPTSDPTGLRAVLSDALGVKGEVRKERRLFLVGQTRVHLDDVEGLGHYTELEVVMRPEQTLEDGQKVAEALMEQLGVTRDSLVTGAYVDLLAGGRTDIRQPSTRPASSSLHLLVPANSSSSFSSSIIFLFFSPSVIKMKNKSLPCRVFPIPGLLFSFPHCLFLSVLSLENSP